MTFMFYQIFFRKKRPKLIALPEDYKVILLKYVPFYRELNEAEKLQFEQRVQNFLSTTKITGVETQVDDTDRLLIGASAIIPVFYFPKWQYINLNEVLLYNNSFNEKFETGRGGAIQGMVGSGYMEGKMILSKPALRLGFEIANDKKNVGIHEFIHLIDKTDGQTDGIPEILLDKQYSIPWINLMQKEIDRIHNIKSDVNPYGGVNKTEFFAVIGEYFFEKPALLKRKHPEIYQYLEKIFTVDLSKKYSNENHTSQLRRNDPCICGSGKKYKNCCLVK